MKHLIVGLGNPGKEYEKNRHNIGFRVIDALAKHWDADVWKRNNRLHVQLAPSVPFEKHQYILAKPEMFMNESGFGVGALQKFFKVRLSNVWVVYDDVDLPLGTLRIRMSGSAGTHNGMKSVVNHLASENFVRFRIGIGREKGRVGDLARFVLKDFAKDEEVEVKKIIQLGVSALDCAAREGVEQAMNKYNRNKTDTELL